MNIHPFEKLIIPPAEKARLQAAGLPPYDGQPQVGRRRKALPRPAENGYAELVMCDFATEQEYNLVQNLLPHEVRGALLETAAKDTPAPTKRVLRTGALKQSRYTIAVWCHFSNKPAWRTVSRNLTYPARAHLLLTAARQRLMELPPAVNRALCETPLWADELLRRVGDCGCRAGNRRCPPLTVSRPRGPGAGAATVGRDGR